MAIYRFLQNAAFAPEDIAPLVAAYEDCLRTLKLSDRSDPITQVLAKKIIAIRQQDAPKKSNTWVGFASQKAGLGSTWEAQRREGKKSGVGGALLLRARVRERRHLDRYQTRSA